MPNQVSNQGDVLSGSDAKPRLKWTPQLHERFLDAVSKLGGVDKATPKSVMRAMGIPGLTLHHLKSHLQKYRIAKNREPNTMDDNTKEADNNRTEIGTAYSNEDQTLPLLNVSMLQMQMEVQRKLQEQIEVQKHLQLRIEAQGKYLQSVLRKAQQTLAVSVLRKAQETRAGNSSNSPRLEAAKAEISELISTVDTECLSSSLSRRRFGPEQAQHANCSTDSCLTSSGRLEAAKDGKRRKLETSSSCHDRSGEVNRKSSGTTENRSMRNGYGVQGELDLNI